MFVGSSHYPITLLMLSEHTSMCINATECLYDGWNKLISLISLLAILFLEVGVYLMKERNKGIFPSCWTFNCSLISKNENENVQDWVSFLFGKKDEEGQGIWFLALHLSHITLLIIFFSFTKGSAFWKTTFGFKYNWMVPLGTT
jgi:hypothetical protein